MAPKQNREQRRKSASRRIALENLTIHLLDWGTEGRQPLLLLHGIGQGAHTWDEFSPFAASDFHVLALDLRGHGDSDWAPGGNYAPERFHEDLAQLVEALGLHRPILCGHSLGGTASIRYAASHPENVRALILVDIGPGLDATALRRMHGPIAIRPTRFESFNAALTWAHEFNPRRSVAQLRERLAQYLVEADEGGVRWKTDDRLSMPESAFVARWIDRLWEPLRKARCPVFLIRGAESGLVSDESVERLSTEIPEFKHVTIAGAGHTVHGDRPEEFRETLLDYLKRFSE